jgi:DNA-binding SARP family transcriptional activator
MAALAIELATSVWADDLRVTVVGAFPGLEDSLGSGRIRYVPSVASVLEDLRRRATADTNAMAAHGASTVNEARAAGLAPDLWPPEIVLLATELTDLQRAQLSDLVLATPRVAVAAVTAGAPLGEWVLDLAATQNPGWAVLQPIGLAIAPQRVPTSYQGHVLELVDQSASDQVVGAPVSEPTVEEVEYAALAVGNQPVEDDLSDATVVRPIMSIVAHGPRIAVLGPVEVDGATGPVEASVRVRLMELAAFIALNGGVSTDQIDQAVWPDRAGMPNVKARSAAVSELRRWFGLDASGQDHLPRHQDESCVRFGATVETDLDEWNALIGSSVFDAPTEKLWSALALVRGAPFAGAHPRRYAWAASTREELTGQIVDVSFELGRRSLRDGRWGDAERAVAVGLRVEPTQEALWRIRILAAHQSLDQPAQAEAIDRLLTITDNLGTTLEPETRHLLESLTPATGTGQLATTAA